MNAATAQHELALAECQLTRREAAVAVARRRFDDALSLLPLSLPGAASRQLLIAELRAAACRRELHDLRKALAWIARAA